MLLLYNALEEGWTIKKQNKSYIFKKSHEGKKEVLDDSYLLKFMKTNLDINKIISCINNANSYFSTLNLSWLDGSKINKIKWIIGCVKGKSYENGLPHTRNNIIIIPKSIINNKGFNYAQSCTHRPRKHQQGRTQLRYLQSTTARSNHHVGH